MPTHLRRYNEPAPVKSCWNEPRFFLTLTRLICYGRGTAIEKHLYDVIFDSRGATATVAVNKAGDGQPGNTVMAVL